MNKIIFKISALLLLASCSEQCAPTANTSNSLAPVVANKKMPPPPPPFPLVSKLLEENKKDAIKDYLNLPGNPGNNDKIKVKHILNVKKDATPFLHVLIDEENDANIKEVFDILLPKANDAEIKALLSNALDEKVGSSNIAEALVQKGYKDSLNTLLKSPIPKDKLKVADKEKFISLLDEDNAKDKDVIQNLFTNTAEVLTFTDTIIDSPNSSLEEKVSIINNLALADAANSADYDEKKLELANKIVADETLNYEKRLELVDKTNLANKDKQYAKLANKIVDDKTLTYEKRLELVDETKLANKDKPYEKISDNIFYDNAVSFTDKIDLISATKFSKDKDKDLYLKSLAEQIVADDNVSYQERLELVDKINLTNKDKQYTELANKIVIDDKTGPQEKLALLTKTKNKVSNDGIKDNIEDNQVEIINSPAIANDPTTFIKAIKDNFEDLDGLDRKNFAVKSYYKNHLSKKPDAEKPKAFADLKTALGMNQYEWNEALTASTAIKRDYFTASGLINDKQSADTTGYKIDSSDFNDRFLSLDELSNLIDNYKSMHIDKSDEDNDQKIHEAFQTLLPDVIYNVLMTASKNLGEPEKIKDLLQSLIDNCGGIIEFNKNNLIMQELSAALRDNIFYGLINISNKFNQLFKILQDIGIKISFDKLTLIAELSQLTHMELEIGDGDILNTTLSNFITLAGGVDEFNKLLNQATKTPVKAYSTQTYSNYRYTFTDTNINLNPLAALLFNKDSDDANKVAHFIADRGIKLISQDSDYKILADMINNDNLDTYKFKLLLNILLSGNESSREILERVIYIYNYQYIYDKGYRYSYNTIEPHIKNSINFMLANTNKNIENRFEYVKAWYIDKVDNEKIYEKARNLWDENVFEYMKESMSSSYYKKGYFKKDGFYSVEKFLKKDLYNFNKRQTYQELLGQGHIW